MVCHPSSDLGTVGLGGDTIGCFAGGGVGFFAGGEGTAGLDLTEVVSFTIAGTAVAAVAAAAAIFAAVTLVSGTFGVTGLTSGTYLYHKC